MNKNYDAANFAKKCRGIKITRHVMCLDGSVIDGRTGSKARYLSSQKVCKQIEEPFGRSKAVGMIGQIKVHRLIA